MCVSVRVNKCVRACVCVTKKVVTEPGFEPVARRWIGVALTTRPQKQLMNVAADVDYTTISVPPAFYEIKIRCV